MKLIPLVAALFLILFFTGDASAQSEKRSFKVPKGVSTINFKGWVAEARKTYDLNLQPGQKVKLSVTSGNGDVYFDAYYYPPDEENGIPLNIEKAKEWTGELPKAIRYSVDVFSTNPKITNFTLTIQVVK
jgi:hypothetical protein